MQNFIQDTTLHTITAIIPFMFFTVSMTKNPIQRILKGKDKIRLHTLEFHNDRYLQC